MRKLAWVAVRAMRRRGREVAPEVRRFLRRTSAPAHLLALAVGSWHRNGSTAATAPTVVSLTFDDGWATQYQVRDMLAAHGMRGTFYVNTPTIGQPGFMTWGQIYALASDGNEIGGHTLDHPDLTTIPLDESRRQVADDREALLARGFDAVSFAYPDGAHDISVGWIVRECGYTSARGAWGLRSADDPRAPCAETIPPLDSFAMRTAKPPPRGNSESVAYFTGLVERAIREGGGWVQFVFHGLGERGRFGTNWTTFAAFVEWLAADPRVRVQSVADVMAASALAGEVRSSTVPNQCPNVPEGGDVVKRHPDAREQETPANQPLGSTAVHRPPTFR